MMELEEFEGIKSFVLDQTPQRKIELLEDAYDESFGTFWAIADIFLKAPCGAGGGLSTEVIDKVFQRKLKENEKVSK